MASSRKARAAEGVSGELVAVAERALRPHVIAGETLTLGLSGGIDSIVLLDVLRQLQPLLAVDVDVLHVNHGLSPNSGTWEAFCRAHCARRRIAFQAVRVEVAGDGANVEEEARLARYHAFERHGGRSIVLAHNRDDQAETVLLRLLRGAGVRGLSGMRSARRLGAGSSDSQGDGQRLLRPLLEVPRSDIERYASVRRLRWIEDESNADRRYARNFLRRDVFPLLEQRFPGCGANLARAAAHLADADDLLEATAREDLRQVTSKAGLEVSKLAAMDRVRAARVLRVALAGKGEPPISTDTTSEVLRQLFDARSDRAPAIELSRTVVRRFRGCVVIDTRGAPTAPWSCVRWEGGATQRLPDGSSLVARRTRGRGISAARLASGQVTLRRRSGGERLRLRADGPSRTLKNLLREHEAPPWQREKMPLLFCDEQLVWVPAVGTACEYLAAPGESAWEFTWTTSGN